MLSTAIVIFRETLEIAMILGVVLAATRNLPKRLRWIVAGLLAGLCGAVLVALFTQSLSSAFSGIGQELFNACVLLVAALMIGCTVLWMRKHARQMSAHLKQVGHDVSVGVLPLYSLAVIIGLSMLREGSEIVMFMYGMMLSGQSHASIASGSLFGLTLGCIAGIMLYYGLLKIPARHALKVTSWMLILLVAGLMSQCAGFLSAAGYFSQLSAPLWDTSWLLSEDSVVGKTLHSLIGYSAQPTSIQLLFYCGTLALMFFFMAIENKRVMVAAVLALFVMLVKTDNASAVDEVYSPIVHKGEAAIEYNGNRTFDTHANKNNVQEQQVELEYGVTDRWTALLTGSFGKDPGESLKMKATQVESIFQFFEQGEYLVDSGMLASYHIATQSGTPDSLESKLLLQSDTGNFTHTANIGLEQTLGRYSGGTGGPDYSLVWSSRYRLAEYFQPGFELQSDLGKDHELGHYNKQEHYIGPAAYGHIFTDFIAGNINYQAAMYAGISNAAAKSAARLLLEYEMHF